MLENVSGAVRLSDGRIAVIEMKTGELRYYDSDGRYLFTAGRRGRGPGEFQRPEHVLRLPGDSLAIWEADIGPVSYFAPDGSFVRRESLDHGRVMSMITMSRGTESLTPLTDGSFVLHVMWRENARPNPPVPGVVYRPEVGYYWFPRDLSRMDSLGWHAGGLPQMFLMVGGRRVHSSMPVPAHARLAASTNPREVFVGDGAVWDIRVYTDAGRFKRIVRLVGELDTIPADSLAAIKERFYSGFPDDWRADQRRVMDAMPRQTHYPAFFDLILDSEGYLWASTRRDEYVFDPAGRWLGKLHVPGRPLDIGRDYVLTLTRDSLGIERLELFDLRR